MTSSRTRPFYVYLQRPDDGHWVTIGRYTAVDHVGQYRYAPSYLEAQLPWAIDPINLPLLADVSFPAVRYRGLHDVLRDAAPDAWGRMLLQREYQLPENAPDADYLLRAGNADRWGALAVGHTRKPSVAALASPGLPQLEALARELLAMASHRPAIDPKLRRRLMATPSLGGARPKATVRDGQTFWLVKPSLATDLVDIPCLEHGMQQWASTAGLYFAPTVLDHVMDVSGLSVLRSRRFDRHGDRRCMTISGASLLQTEYPGGNTASWSYPLLAMALKQIGAPDEDRQELFERMVFNALIGNDDDHPRNHAALYCQTEKRWRLAPAFDVVPAPGSEHPRSLAMQLSTGRKDVSQASLLAEAHHFGFLTRQDAETHLNNLLQRFQAGFEAAARVLSPPLCALMAHRLAEGLTLLRPPEGAQQRPSGN
ncbi:MAG: HipA domain-containing protein [Pigmentiphaga sp.]|nr:HipA domain-containing protein [Pigmentiphaga sp.]